MFDRASAYVPRFGVIAVVVKHDSYHMPCVHDLPNNSDLTDCETSFLYVSLTFVVFGLACPACATFMIVTVRFKLERRKQVFSFQVHIRFSHASDLALELFLTEDQMIYKSETIIFIWKTTASQHAASFARDSISGYSCRLLPLFK